MANGATSHYYNWDRYNRECVEAVGPPTCDTFQKALDELKWQETAANHALQEGKGKLPKVAKKAVKKAMADVDAAQ